MRKLLLLIIFFQLLGCQKKSEPSEKYIKNSKGEIYIAILDNYHYPPIRDKNSWLTKDEIKKVDAILIRAVNDMNKEIEKDYYKYKFEHNLSDYQVELKNYKRQYFPYINQNGEKEVWVNCLCRDRNDFWLKEFYGVDGGGKCYFMGFVNLDRNSFREFMTNAPL